MPCPKILWINTSLHVLKKLLLPITLNWAHHGFNAWFTYLNHQCTRNTSVWDYNETSQPGHLANWNLLWPYCEAICLLQRSHITSYNIVITGHGVCMLLRWFTVVSWCGMAACISQRLYSIWFTFSTSQELWIWFELEFCFGSGWFYIYSLWLAQSHGWNNVAILNYVCI